MNVRSLTVSPYAMMAALTDNPLQSSASRLLCELVRSEASSDALLAAALLVQQNAHLQELDRLGEHAQILAQDMMGYLFFGVVQDPEYQEEIAAHRVNLHPSISMPSTAEYCLTKAADAVREVWLARAGTIEERVFPAYVGAIDIAVRRCLSESVHERANHARMMQWQAQRNALNHTHDYAIANQPGYAQMLTDLEFAAREMLELAERRAMVLEKDGKLPPR